MNAIAWNCQGAEAYLTKQHFKELLHCFNPSFLFLSETKNNFSFMQDFQFDFGYDKLFTVEPSGTSGGLALFYMNDSAVKIVYSNDRMIDVEAQIEGHKVYITFVYGDPVVTYRENVWERLTRMSIARSGAWMMIRDFNEITSNSEKKGGRKRPETSFIPFKTMLANCGMIDFPFKGNAMSWAGRRKNGRVQCRLDRAVGNEDWHNLFSHTEVEYLLRWGSDHRQVLARIKSQASRPRRNFRFDKRWFGKEGFSTAVKNGWGRSDQHHPGNLVERLYRCRKAISVWKRSNLSNNEKLIELLKEKIDKAQCDDNMTAEEELELKWQLCAAYGEEEIYWRQKSRAIWLREGDRNTKYFHAKTKQRRARNRITRIKNSMGAWVETEDGIEQVAVQYFGNLFETSSPVDIGESIRYITETVTEEMNEALTAPVTDTEIRDAVFAINPDKAPGPDGMTSLFYQRFRSIIGKDVISMVREFFETGELDERINQTNICLIPKTARPVSMTEFRPISLCNISYKIISKVLSNRLKRIFPSLISETQSAFVARRLITDNILVAQEMFHALRTNQSCQSKYMAIKTDMSKAYDRLEWGFLEASMEKMGFDQKWIHLIMSCVSSVSYRVLINGDAKGSITPSRGLRQGDPLSPFLFILCTEVLISQIQEAERTERITGLRIARSSPAVSHLLFADDSLFFCKAEESQCQELMRIIDVYGYASGQQLNKQKSSVLFGSKVITSTKQNLKGLTGINKEGGMGMYLGLPENICGSKKKVFAYVQDRLNSRVNTWEAKHLSKGGKEVQIKSVAQAVPTFTMSCYLLPQEIHKKLTGAVSRFWWSAKANNRGLHWVAWDKICEPQEKGGLGFRDSHDFNLALLAKQVWRLLIYPDSLLARVLKGRYYRNSNPLRVGKANNPSYGWRSIWTARSVLSESLLRSIGTGADTNVWEDGWIPDGVARPALPKGPVIDHDLRVHHLLDHETKDWNEPLIRELVAEEDVNKILSIKPSRLGRKDGYIWKHTKSGSYTVRTGYEVINEKRKASIEREVAEPSVTTLKKEVWKLKTSRKIKHFLWQAISGFVNAASRLCDRHCANDRSCLRCGAAEETINHILFECPPALQCWALSDIPTHPGLFPCNALFTNFDHLLWRAENLGVSKETLNVFPWLLWYIWKGRNEKLFNGVEISPLDTLQLALSEAKSWQVAQIIPSVEEGAVPEAQESTGSAEPSQIRTGIRCQVDASWVHEGSRSGVGFALWEGANRNLIGLKNCRQSASPLHAEADGLMWAMKTLWDQGYRAMHFETDCAQLLKLIQNVEEWPSMVHEMEDIRIHSRKFDQFTISYIPRGMNSRADCLAKAARVRLDFFEFVGVETPVWLAHVASLLE